MTKSVLFVCLGNICRSPMAEIIMRKTVKDLKVEHEWKIDSAGTAGYHIGEAPDERTVRACRKFYKDEYPEYDYRARQLSVNDFKNFDYILCMDSSNLEDVQYVQKKCKDGKAVVKLLGAFDPEGGEPEVPDPYYGGEKGFDDNFHLITRCIQGFIKHVENK